MFLPRLLTALIGIPVLLFLIYWGGMAYGVFILGVSILCLYEYGIILTLARRPVRPILAIAGGAVISICAIWRLPVEAALAAFLSAAVLFEVFSREHSLERLAITVFGSSFFGILPSYLGLIRELGGSGRVLSFLFFSCVWAMDTAAYAAGKSLGRRRLAPVLSPKKTWEGAAAGFAAALATAAIFSRIFPSVLSETEALALGSVIGIFGQLSDLSESLIKRSVGAKDSGMVLPGHGGIMDRFDSFLLSAPAFYYCLLAFGSFR
ncbi:MAG: phosphatidate cytidylyltransferase [Elusimicrobiota bacterium]